MRPLILVACCLLPVLASAAEPVDYERDVAPLLQHHCAGCHAGGEAEGGYSLDTAQQLLGGGDSGVAITPGSPASSRLWLMVSGQLAPQMPPEDQPPLSPAQLAVLETWIEQGAQLPDGDGAMRRELRTPQIEPAADRVAPVTAMALAPDGQTRAQAGFRRIEILDQQGRVIRTITGDFGKVNALQFSRDGSRLLMASGTTGLHGLAALVDVASGELIKEFVGHRDILYAAVFAPDESLIATAGYDREIILWDVQAGEPVRRLSGHNGAIFDLAFSPDGSLLASACGDQTVKIWHVPSGQRLDTLGQSEGEVFAVEITRDAKHVIAASADNRLRVWSLVSTTRPEINPLVASRFIDESPLTHFAVTPDGEALVVLSASGDVKVLDTADWSLTGALEPLSETASDLVIDPASREVTISLMNGEIAKRPLPGPDLDPISTAGPAQLTPVYMVLDPPTEQTESALREVHKSGDLPVDRGAVIRGAISQPGESDQYRWRARRGEVWAIDADAGDNSPLDPIVIVLDQDGEPVLHTRLQGVRETYFTFRGKDSSQISDFRLFNWQELGLNEYLYAAGEVTRLYLHPRGPDSGFNVYPNEGNRWTYFGTSHRAHALGEPAYIVRPLAEGEPELANGLPVFDIYYENDDDPQRLAGTNSRLLFTAPDTGDYHVQIADTRGEGGDAFAYRLAIRAATPDFRPQISQPPAPIFRGAGREFMVRVDRTDGFDGPVTFEIRDLPPGLYSNSPVTVEAGQRYAVANLWADESAAAWEGELSAPVVAHAVIGGRYVERAAGAINKLQLADAARAVPSIQPIDGDVPAGELWTLQVRRGETVSARVVLDRRDDFRNEVRFGNENSGRNTPHGVYVDNIGLNGLLVRQDEHEREFFLTADPVAPLGKRLVHLAGEIDGPVTTPPIVVEVLP